MQTEEFAAPETFVASPDYFDRAAESVSDSTDLSNKDGDEEDDGIRDDFEFALLCDDPEFATADEIFLNGQIRPVYPLFDKELFRLYQGGGGGGEKFTASRVVPLNCEERAAVRAPLRELMRKEGREGDLPTSSEDDELSGIPAESYCLWTPGTTPVPLSPEMRRKSKSTGSSSLRWKFRDLVIGRSHSDGKKKYIFLAHAHAHATPEPEKKHAPEGDMARRKEKDPKANMAAVHRLYYAKADATATGDRRRSYLPYKKDLVGFLAGGGFRP